MENVEEETEAAVAREMSRDRERGAPLPEVIDLTEHKLEEELESDRNSSRDGLSPLQLRVSGTRTSLQASPGIIIDPLLIHKVLNDIIFLIHKDRPLFHVAITLPDHYLEPFPALWFLSIRLVARLKEKAESCP